MTEHQQDHEPVDVVFNERLATRLHSWLLIMCLSYPVVLVGMFLLSPMLAMHFGCSGICQLLGTVFPIAMVFILANIKQQDSVPISWFLIIAPAVWIAALSCFYSWLMMGFATSAG